ncbi:hypothetical protein ATE84_2764 [Aquimarina sp. MAR_2010_214]|uniref:hypothetical protein n=1 Tax=Aquimarina sp. MAR_2010_214 TaxID=1250026 RepID=UPI000C6FD58D|nr:hypothetical protein [Aquimarina sp. MAR_2010_214]PKV50698.1 hypothetical protein ATE84_2764 [Aquimarina sp. MAR_2010_214]
MIRKNRIVIILLLFMSAVGISQTENSVLSKKEKRKNRPAYIGFAAGLGTSSFRDFATSPLFYRGIPRHISLSYTKMDLERESEVGASYLFGQYHNSFNKHSESSKLHSVSLFYSRLYRLNKLSSPKLNVKVGGLFNATTNFRTNEGFGNNGIGVEIIPTLFGSVKIEKDISRKEEKSKKFLFIKYKLKKRTRNLAFRLNVGLVNSSFRNGYVYNGQAALLNEADIFDEYKFDMFSGFRVNSSLDYTISLKNKNALRFSYVWDAYKTGGDFDKFEMSAHLFKLTFLFNTNNK